MIKKNKLKRYIRQNIALIKKNIYLEWYVRSVLLTRFLNPMISLFVFIFIFSIIFNNDKTVQIGYWNSSNYILFILLAFCIQLSRSITIHFTNSFMKEKYWKTLSAIMIAPINRYTLLISSLSSELIIISIPLAITIILAFILFPIPLIFLFLTILIFLIIYIVLASIGLILGAFSISNEKYVQYLALMINFVFLFSCTNYPKEIFPEFIQIFIIINPFYYLFDLLRLIWFLGIDYEMAIKNITLIHIIIAVLSCILAPLIAVNLFNRIYKKYGIAGY